MGSCAEKLMALVESGQVSPDMTIGEFLSTGPVQAQAAAPQGSGLGSPQVSR